MHRHPLQAPPAHAPIADRFSDTLDRFLRVEAASGVVLLGATVVALGWANAPSAGSYDAFWHAPLTLGAGAFVVTQPLHFWINEWLMTVFFLVVGLEIRRELHEGVLATLRVAALPFAAALGGIVVPAVVFLLTNADAEGRQGWAIPTATDIAFALGVLALLGRRIPSAARVLLLALAIIDDIVAILVIAFVYSDGVGIAGLAIAAAGIAGVIAWQRLGVRSAWGYVIPGAVTWFGLLHAGVHPTLAGVVLGLMTPVRPLPGAKNPVIRALHALREVRRRNGRDRDDMHSLVHPLKELQRAQLQLIAPVARVQAILHPWVAFGIMPLFALANAGVRFDGLAIEDGVARGVGLGVVLGLVVGKPLGIVSFSWLAVRLRLCELPRDLGWSSLTLVGCLGGIGFTMSIFIGTLAFGDESLLAAAKLAVLLASTAAALLGLGAGWLMFGRGVRKCARS